MAKVGAQRAAELTGKSKSTIQRAMNNGKISYEKSEGGTKVIDVSELERVFGLSRQQDEASGSSSSSSSSSASSVESELQRAAEMIENERTKMRVKMLEEQVSDLERQLDDMKGQRDQWQKQAQQVLLTSQYSQKQAEELQEKLEERERREEQRRKQAMEAKMKQRAQQQQGGHDSQSASTASQDNEKDGSFKFLRRFKKAS